jgi:hypothetical protein
MSNSNTDFLSFLSENDPLGLLKSAKPQKPKAKRSVLLNNFEEIVNFFEEYNREPRNSSKDIKEFQLYHRLKAIRSNAEMAKELKPYDMYGLLNGESVSTITLDDFLNDDPLNLLGGDMDDSIFELRNVRKSERISPEYISRRQFCQDFELYKPMFDAMHQELESGERKLAVYHSEDLKPNQFYVLGGIILFLKSVEGTVSTYNYSSGDRDRYDGRTFCIFDNGTTSDMLYRSLDKALQKDGYSISERLQPSLAVESVNEDDLSMGYVYVLRSHNAILKEVPNVFKIGSTTNTVSERIRNAPNEPTYLYAGVDVVETYRCFNMRPRELEDKLHTFFDRVRLNINIPDERGVIISPREWFRVKLEVIGEAVELILDNTINNYIYDPSLEKIVAR